ncbi:lysosomal acid phosphatase-like [Contarinia nasturtii]|uniref:lysosomal acid phosphatase-like n=1 Tax=Contarinia nasturtii TaxID=265458 RepID=UPI0012D40288|nr:lysosomal acid phosphatase-like [Contarinia nasturtii]
MSAEACMAGMFPPTASQKWKKTLNWHPIPVHTIPRREDHLLASEKRCDHFDDVMLQYMNTTAYTDLFTKHKTLISYLERNSGMKLSTITEIYLLYDALWVEKMEGKRLPDWAENVMKSGGDFEYLAICYFKIYSETTEMKKLKSGFLLKEIFDRFTSKIQSNLSPDRSLVMYFAHDITITNMLSSLGLYKLHQPKYASCMFFQLYSSDEMPYVKIFYRKSGNVVNIKPLNIPNCGSKCPLEKLYELYQHILPTQQFDKECALRDGHTLPPGGNPENAPY